MKKQRILALVLAGALCATSSMASAADRSIEVVGGYQQTQRSLRIRGNSFQETFSTQNL